jgi:hypothetical protein
MADLRGATLGGANLTGADLTGANLKVQSSDTSRTYPHSEQALVVGFGEQFLLFYRCHLFKKWLIS